MTSLGETTQELSEVFLWQKSKHTGHTSSYAYDSIKHGLEAKTIAPQLHFIKEFNEYCGYIYTTSCVFHHELGVTGILRSGLGYGERDTIYLKGETKAIDAARKNIELIIKSTGFEFEEMPKKERRNCLL